MPSSPREAPEAPEAAEATLIFGFLHLPYCNTEAKEVKKLWRTSSQTCVGLFCPILACAQEDLAEVHAEGTTGAKKRKLAALLKAAKAAQPRRGGKRKREGPTAPPDASL